MKRPLFTGLCTALVTPFLEERVNYPMFRLLLQRQIQAGVDAVVVAGTTGESPTLTKEEKLELFRLAVDTAEGRCKVIAGTGSNCTKNAVELSREAQSLGVDGLLVVTPYYNKCTQSGLVKHYTAVAEAVSIPILAYNVPSRTGVDIGVDACRELAKLPGIAGIKEASGDISKVARIADLMPVYSGNDDQTAAVMALGGLGVISVTSNLIPKVMKTLTDSALAGDFALAAVLQKRLLPLMDLMFCQVNPIPVKAAMGMLGYDVGQCRMPLDALTLENTERIAKCLDECCFGEYNR